MNRTRARRRHDTAAASASWSHLSANTGYGRLRPETFTRAGFRQHLTMPVDLDALARLLLWLSPATATTSNCKGPPENLPELVPRVKRGYRGRPTCPD